jgi:cell division protein FtsL
VTTAEKYVAAAFVVVFAVLAIYLAIISAKLGRLSRETAEVERLVRERPADG